MAPYTVFRSAMLKFANADLKDRRDEVCILIVNGRQATKANG